MFGEPGPRAERGGVKYLILDAVADAPRHGYEIIQVIEERSKGAYRPSAGVGYPTLQLLDETGLLVATEKDGRKTYAITPEGRAELDANRETVRDFYDQQDDSSWEDFADELGEFSRRLMELVKPVHRAARHGRISAKSMRQLARSSTRRSHGSRKRSPPSAPADDGHGGYKRLRARLTSTVVS